MSLVYSLIPWRGSLPGTFAAFIDIHIAPSLCDVCVNGVEIISFF